jgi:regulatory protein
MAGKITRLEYQKRNPDRANIYIDDQFALGVPALEAAKLHVGQHLSDEDIAQLRARDGLQKAYERALRFLGYRARSRAEVQRNLQGAGLDEATIQAVLDRLAGEGYLNDAEFARFWVENREQFGPRGNQALRYELRRKGVDDKTAAEALANVDQVASAYRAGQPKAARLAALAANDPRSFREKLSSFLLRRGFTYEVVRTVVKQLVEELGGTTDQLASGDDEGA